MRRREFIAACGSAVLWSFGARAQQPDRLRRIGVLTSGSENDPESKRYFGSLVQGLQKLGWIEGRNFQFEIRRATGGVITKELADDLARLQLDVLIGASTAGLRMLQQATRTIPIVFIGVSDPVRDGFVASLARPSGNITGFSSTEPSMVDKWYELLKGIAPQTAKALILFNPNTAPQSLYLERLKATAPSFGLEAIPAPVQTSADIESALSRVSGDEGWGMVSMPDSFLWVHRQQVSNLAAQHRVPAIYPLRAHATSGGLISYGVDFVDLWARAATYIDRILKGERPSDLSVQRPVTFETVVNLKAAKALGLVVPDAVLVQADEIIE
ncbi:ABC transporter substrate-binding protein [Microvirga aerilata]|uniref:ABC transporter substrate-binding protein n=1 Tax=Microvirga aerilata TaxID=670292 RepID=A0A936ZIL6_9HYPH|nr:ABC transporter substrate-binding protein [Microvirga aerilata]MBL0407877.1 ABC transporter substrate-binding protein [Microvirga aerilata]